MAVPLMGIRIPLQSFYRFGDWGNPFPAGGMYEGCANDHLVVTFVVPLYGLRTAYKRVRDMIAESSLARCSQIVMRP